MAHKSGIPSIKSDKGGKGPGSSGSQSGLPGPTQSGPNTAKSILKKMKG